MTMSGMLPLPAKSVLVFRNGDPYYTGRKLLVRPHPGTTLEAFLNEVTLSIGAAVAVRTLHTPRHGHRVRDLQELQHGERYVAAGFERFKKLDYLNAGTRKAAVPREDGAQIKPSNRPSVSAKWRKVIHLPCIIHVFRNGDVLNPPVRFILPWNLQRNLEQILVLVSEKASLRTGAVRRLCSLEGVTVSAVEELQSGQYYVAVGTEKFKKLPYMELLVPKASASGLRSHARNRRFPDQYETRKPVSVPQDRYSDSALLASPEEDGRRVKSTGDEADSDIRKQGKTLKEEEPIFYAKPVRVQKNRAGPRAAAPRRGQDPSVFKGDVRKRREEVQGAQEVPEDEHTAIELPLDQRAAEVVEDEVLDVNGHLKQEVASSKTHDDTMTSEGPAITGRLNSERTNSIHGTAELDTAWSYDLGSEVGGASNSVQTQKSDDHASRPASKMSRSSPNSSDAELN